MKASNRGREFIKGFEALKLKAYRCPAGRWTIGYGHTGLDVSEGTVWTKAKSENVFEKDLAFFESGVRRELGRTPVTQGQFDALVSFAYNLGLHNLSISLLLQKLRAGDINGAAEELNRPPKWCTAGGVIQKGLVRRRLAERTMFLEGSDAS